ncbi:ribonucleoside-diphosphate reductase subunit alpha, partial [Listeria monocytogenes]|nr:ribonucleoside-diphosphate reductase subunit alpha [Listeria monocytogenes]
MKWGLQMTTYIVKDGGNRKLPFDKSRLDGYLEKIHEEFPKLDLEDYKRKVFNFVEKKEDYAADELVDYLIREAEARTDIHIPEWEHFAARLYLNKLYKKASKNRFYNDDDKYGSYVGLQESLGERGIYSGNILKNYSKEDLIA